MIPLFKVTMDHERALHNLAEVLPSGYIGQGPWVDRFENELSAMWGVDPALVVTVNSGTSALQLALAMCGVEPGVSEKRVGVAAITCMADAHAVRAQGGTVTWLDLHPRTGLLLGVHTGVELSAVIPTDLGGFVPDADELRHYYKGVPIIQDAAQNLLGRRYGDIVCYSFQAIKHLTTGDGGACIFRDRAMADEARLKRWFGLDRKASTDFRCQQNIKTRGYKMHLTDIAAAIGCANIPMAKMAVESAQANAHYYQVMLPQACLVPWQDHASYWSYMILVEDRAEFITHMVGNGVGVSPVQAIGTKHDIFPKAALPGAEWYGARNVAIPNGWWVSQRERSKIADLVRSFLERKRHAIAV